MPRNVELDLALAGLALARNWLVGEAAVVEQTLEEIRRLAGSDRPDSFESAEFGVAEGYDEWAASYDAPTNPVVTLEAPVVRRLLEELEPRTALDAACGTGRHSAVLVELGHRVVGVDVSEAMLERARARVPQADFRVGDLTSLPVGSGSVELAVCALALTHLADPAPAIAELGRAVRRGGRVIVSDVHPVLVALGAQAAFRSSGERRGYVRNYVHWPGTYLRAFAAGGLRVDACHDVLYGREQIDLWAAGLELSYDVVVEAIQGLPGIVVWEATRE